MKVLRIIASLLFVICLPFLLVTSNLRLAVNEIRLYEYGFDRYVVGKQPGLEKDELLRITEGLIGYFNSREELFQREGSEFFNKRELAHFKDVKGLIQLCYRLQEIVIGYIFVYILLSYALWRKAFWRHLMKRIIWGSSLIIALSALLGIWSLIDFDSLFLVFHLTSFRNLLWLAEPGDLMIRMFPPDFFFDAALFLVGGTSVEALILGGAAWGWLRKLT